MEESRKKTSTTVGVSGCELLQIAFIVLKLCKVINWSWLWVLAPTWLPLALLLLGLLITVIVAIMRK